MRYLRASLAWMLLGIGVGCSAPKQTFTVDVVNRTTQPLSVDIIKTGGTVPGDWASPEQIAIHAPQYAERKWGVLVPAGQKVTIGPKTAPFEGGSRAGLRIYTGDRCIEELISFGRNDPGRLEIFLWPGHSGYIIDAPQGTLRYTPMDDQRPAPGARG